MGILILTRLGKSHNYISNFKEWLTDYSGELIVLTRAEIVKDFEDYTKVYGVEDFDSDNLFYTTSIKIFKEFNIDRVIALDERDIIRAARLRERYGIKGQNVASALSFRNKYLMKKYVENSKIPLPAYSKTNDILDILDFINIHHFPVVIKNLDGFGGYRTHILNNYKTLDNILNNYNFDNKLIESYIDADVYETDGIFMDNEIKFISCARNSNPPIHINQKKDIWVELIEPYQEIFEILKDSTEEILKNLPYTPNTVFHCELYVDKDFNIIFCEIASRTVGRRISEAIKISYNIDLNECQSRLQANLDITKILTNAKYTRSSAVYISTIKTQKLISYPKKLPFEGVIEYWPRISEKTIINDSSYVMSTTVLSAKNKNLLQNLLQNVHRYLNDNTIWSDNIE